MDGLRVEITGIDVYCFKVHSVIRMLQKRVFMPLVAEMTEPCTLVTGYAACLQIVKV